MCATSQQKEENRKYDVFDRQTSDFLFRIRHSIKMKHIGIRIPYDNISNGIHGGDVLYERTRHTKFS